MPTPFTTLVWRAARRPARHPRLRGTTTRYGGSRMRPETIEAMREAAQVHGEHRRAERGRRRAAAAHAWPLPPQLRRGFHAGLVLQAAACMTGDDPAGRSRGCPDASGPRNEPVSQRAHRCLYDQAYRVPGGVLVEIGLGRRTAARRAGGGPGRAHRRGDLHYVSPFTSHARPPALRGGGPHRARARGAGAGGMRSVRWCRAARSLLFRSHPGRVPTSPRTARRQGHSRFEARAIVVGRADLIRAAALNASRATVPSAAPPRPRRRRSWAWSPRCWRHSPRTKRRRWRSFPGTPVREDRGGGAGHPGLRAVVEQDSAEPR